MKQFILKKKKKRKYYEIKINFLFPRINYTVFFERIREYRLIFKMERNSKEYIKISVV